MSRHSPPDVVSVVIPTLRRPRLLADAVRSVLAQRVPDEWDLEIVVSISNPDIVEDVSAAEALAAADSRIRVVEARRLGGGAARNAGVAAARGSIVVFMDDDCRAQDGWLASLLGLMSAADIVQGRTVADGAVPRFHRTMWVTPPSWLWETCNLGVKKSVFDRVGGFDESWNAAGRVGEQHGEDVEFGWRVVRSGGQAAFAPEAVVHHVVHPRTFGQHLRYKAGIRNFPRIFRTTPEARRVFYLNRFVS